jgi:hypothetical protein
MESEISKINELNEKLVGKLRVDQVTNEVIPLLVKLPDGTVIELKMITESEFGILVKDGDHPDQPAECVWSKDYEIHNAES